MASGGFGLQLVYGKVREQLSHRDCKTAYFCRPSQDALLVIFREEMAAFI